MCNVPENIAFTRRYREGDAEVNRARMCPPLTAAEAGNFLWNDLGRRHHLRERSEKGDCVGILARALAAELLADLAAPLPPALEGVW